MYDFFNHDALLEILCRVVKCKSEMNGPDKDILNGSLSRNASYMYKLGSYYDELDVDVFPAELSFPLLRI
jgi:hypothetical protein